MPGILMSRNTRSGASRSTSVTPSSPVAAPHARRSRRIRGSSATSRGSPASSSMTRMRGFTDDSVADGADGALIELGLVEVDREHVARRARAPTMRRKPAIEFDRLAIDLEDDRAALDAAVVGDRQRLDALHQHAGHARRDVEAARVAVVDLAQAEAELAGTGALRSSARPAVVRAVGALARGRSASFTDTSMVAAVAHVLAAARRCPARARRSRESARSCVCDRLRRRRRRSRRRAAGRRARPASPAVTSCTSAPSRARQLQRRAAGPGRRRAA